MYLCIMHSVFRQIIISTIKVHVKLLIVFTSYNSSNIRVCIRSVTVSSLPALVKISSSLSLFAGGLHVMWLMHMKTNCTLCCIPCIALLTLMQSAVLLVAPFMYVTLKEYGNVSLRSLQSGS